MTISSKGLNFICSFEGFSAKPYPDPASGSIPYTIGYGTTVYPGGKKVTLADAPVTKAQAKGFLQDYIDHKISGWLTTGLPSLTQTQFDALCSFIYNVGLANFKKSSLQKAIKSNAGNDVITADFKKWDEAAGKVMPGLVKRRSAEAALFCDGIYPA